MYEELFDYKFVANVYNKQHMSLSQLYDAYKQDDAIWHFSAFCKLPSNSFYLVHKVDWIKKVTKLL